MLKKLIDVSIMLLVSQNYIIVSVIKNQYLNSLEEKIITLVF